MKRTYDTLTQFLENLVDKEADISFNRLIELIEN